MRRVSENCDAPCSLSHEAGTNRSHEAKFREIAAEMCGKQAQTAESL
jgi:hypothetical protein